jgi:hypothetical protein
MKRPSRVAGFRKLPENHHYFQCITVNFDEVAREAASSYEIGAAIASFDLALVRRSV